MRAERFVEVAVAGTGFEEVACGLEVFDQASRERRGRLDIVVADVIAVGL